MYNCTEQRQLNQEQAKTYMTFEKSQPKGKNRRYLPELPASARGDG
jgi:hypothetical protein